MMVIGEMETHHIFKSSSLFAQGTTEFDIECERQKLEAENHCCLQVYEIDYPTVSGTHCKRVTWEIV
jgi:hypothetical protein